MQKTSQKTKKTMTKKRAPKKTAPRAKPAKTRKEEPTRESFADLTRDVTEAPIIDPSIMDGIRDAEAQVRAAIKVVASTPDLAERLSDPRSHPKLISTKGMPWTLEALCGFATKDGMRNEDWPEFCSGDGAVRVKRGTAPSVKIPAAKLEAWFRGDKDVLKPRQVDLEGEIVLQKDGASYRVIRSLRHYFESGPYEATIPKSKFALVKSQDVNLGEKHAIIDRCTHLKTEVKEDPGDKERARHKEIILGLMLVAKPAEDEDDGDAEREDE